MPKLSLQQRLELIKLTRKLDPDLIGTEGYNTSLNQALKLLHSPPEDIDRWQKSKVNDDIKKLNIVYDQLNHLLNRQLSAEESILTSSTKLLSDFQGAEADATKAIELMSANPKLYTQYVQELDSYFKSAEAMQITQRKKMGESIDHPQSILDKQQFIKEAKILVNTLANTMMKTNSEFRKNREQFIKQTLESPKYGAKFIDRDGQIQFRAIRLEGDYGKPEIAFQEGLAPQYVSMWQFQSGVISTPYVNDAFETTGEKVGWTGGITSTSANLKFCAAFDFAASYGLQDGYIYAYACDEAASVARHIQFGTGYDGKVNKTEGIERSNAEAAMEYMIPYLSPDRIVGARKINKDGSLGEYLPNPNVSHSAFGDTEYLKLILCESVTELKLIEYLERRNVEVLHHDQEASYANEMVKLFSELPTKRQAIVLKLAHTSQIALNKQLIDNLNPYLKTTNPKKWEALEKIQYTQLSENPIDILPNTLKSTLNEKQKTIKSELNTLKGKVQVASNFEAEFERDKRVTKERTTEINPASQRFTRPQHVEPIDEDILEDISKQKPSPP